MSKIANQSMPSAERIQSVRPHFIKRHDPASNEAPNIRILARKIKWRQFKRQLRVSVNRIVLVTFQSADETLCYFFRKLSPPVGDTCRIFRTSGKCCSCVERRKDSIGSSTRVTSGYLNTNKNDIYR